MAKEAKKNEAWLAAHPTDICDCTHTAKLHHKGKSCTHSDPKTFKFCGCSGYRPGTAAVEGQAVSSEGSDMVKKTKKVKKAASAKKDTRTVTRYHVTEQEPPERLATAAKEGTSHTGLLYGIIKKGGKGGVTQAEMREAMTPSERGKMKNCTQSTLFTLKKGGYIKVTKEEEKVKAAA
jgi:hypothetical protein